MSSTTTTESLWHNEAEAKMLENRILGFWNNDYFTQILLPKLHLKPGDTVLDVGAGTGALTLLLAHHNPDVQFTGVDLAAPLITAAEEQAKQMNLNNVSFRECNALDLPFDDDAFDAVVCQTLIMHVPDQQKAMHEMARVLKPGGSMMAAEFHILCYDAPVENKSSGLSMQQQEAINRCMLFVMEGYKASRQGNFRTGGLVPFLAIEAGLEVRDIRINDRVTYAFPPYKNASEQRSLVELQGWQNVIKDAGYKAWITGNTIAGGGTEADAETLLSFLPVYDAKDFEAESSLAFVWLLNPVLLVTIAKKNELHV